MTYHLQYYKATTNMSVTETFSTTNTFQKYQPIRTICCRMSHIEEDHMKSSRDKSYFIIDFEKTFGKPLLDELLDILKTSNDVCRKNVPYEELNFFKLYGFPICETFNKETKLVDTCSVLKVAVLRKNDRYFIVTAFPYRQLPLHKTYANPLKNQVLRPCPSLLQKCTMVTALMKCECFKKVRQRKFLASKQFKLWKKDDCNSKGHTHQKKFKQRRSFTSQRMEFF